MGGDGLYGAVGEVEAGLLEVFVEEVADEVDGVAVGVADEAAVGVLPYVERQTSVVVVVEGAEGFVSRDLEPQPLRDLLDGEIAKQLNILSFHNY